MNQELEQKIKRRLTNMLGPISLGAWRQDGMFEWSCFVNNDAISQWQITVFVSRANVTMTIVKYVDTVVID